MPPPSWPRSLPRRTPSDPPRSRRAARLHRPPRPHPRPLDRPAVEERLTQWCDVLADVAPAAPHPEGRHWDASQAARRHITTSPYPIKPSDVSIPWADFKRDILSRHFDPVPNVDPDNETAYRAAIADHRRAIETGQTVATPGP